MSAKPPALANEYALVDPPPEFTFRPACGTILENGQGVMVSGLTIGFREIDDVGGSIKELVDALAEVAEQKRAEEAVEAPSAIAKEFAKQRIKSTTGDRR